MKLYYVNVVLQDKPYRGECKPAYSIGCEASRTFRDALTVVQNFIGRENTICCSAYVKEWDTATNKYRILYARNFVSMLGDYYPDVRNYEGVHFDIDEELIRYSNTEE